ncbi:MAG TPA: hypothetical protein PKA02_02935, partial [Candidatus Saccharibacteria bacterium]|nr:hypothetical protein [Candidatus Saccharibacteria bacterium]
MTQGMDAYPSQPPVAPPTGPPVGDSMLYGAGTAPGAAEAGAQPERRGRGRLIGGVVAAVVIGGALTANAMTGGDGDQKHVDSKEYAADLQAQSGDQVDVCPTGMYDSKKPFALAKNVKPGYLQEAPKGNILDNPESFISWQYGSETTGEKGALCALPTEVATFEHVFNQWVGTNSDGSKVRPFDSTLGDINELTGFYAIHDDKAEATISSEPFKAFMANFKPNEEALKGTWSRLLLNGEKVAQQHVDVEGIKPGDALILKGDVWVGDGKYTSKSQIVAILGDGTVLVKRSLGVETIAPAANATTTSEANNGGGDASTEGDQDSNTGGASNQTDQSGANGDVGSCSHGVPGGCDGGSPGG